MRHATLLCVCSLLFTMADAQFSLVPQAGFESAASKVKVNNGKAVSPAQAINMPQANLRLSYLFRKSHGPYIGIGTSRSDVKMNFQNAENPMTGYTTQNGKAQLRLEGGYMVSSKKIMLKKNSVRPANRVISKTDEYKSRCGSYSYKSGCHSKMKEMPAKSSASDTWMRIQPSVGLATVPFSPSFSDQPTSASTPTYSYTAGKMTTAIVTGLGFEFGKGRASNFILNINYLNRLGKDEFSLLSGPDNKPVVTKFQSSTRAWNVQLGFPINLSKKKSAYKKLNYIKTTSEQKSNCTERRQCYHRCAGQVKI